MGLKGVWIHRIISISMEVLSTRPQTQTDVGRTFHIRTVEWPKITLYFKDTKHKNLSLLCAQNSRSTVGNVQTSSGKVCATPKNDKTLTSKRQYKLAQQIITKIQSKISYILYFSHMTLVVWNAACLDLMHSVTSLSHFGSPLGYKSKYQACGASLNQASAPIQSQPCDDPYGTAPIEINDLRMGCNPILEWLCKFPLFSMRSIWLTSSKRWCWRFV